MVADTVLRELTVGSKAGAEVSVEAISGAEVFAAGSGVRIPVEVDGARAGRPES